MRKEYYIPTMEVTFLKTADLMWGLEGSGSHGQAQTQAPARFAPVPDGGVKAF